MINILDLPQTNSFGGFPPNSEEQVTKMIKILKVIDPVCHKVASHEINASHGFIVSIYGEWFG